MSWDAVSAIAELVAAISVLITLIYLARQIRENRESVKSASAETVLSNLSAAYQNAAGTSDLGRILLTGQESMEDLTEDERGRWLFWFYGYFRTLELAYHHYLSGNFDASIWNAYAGHTRSLLNTSGVRHYWEMRRDVFSPEFVSYIDNLASESSELVPSYLAAQKLSRAKE